MSEADKQPEKKVLSLGAKPKLEIKRPLDPMSGNAGQVRQSFSHGRSKAVAVEIKRPRVAAPAAPAGTGPAAPAVTPGGNNPAPPAAAPAPGIKLTQRGAARSAVIRELTSGEREARARALRDAQEQQARHVPAAPGGDEPVAAADLAVETTPAAPTSLSATSTADALRAREMEELRRIQQQERDQQATSRARPEVRYADAATTRIANRAGDSAAAKLTGEEGEETPVRRSPVRGSSRGPVRPPPRPNAGPRSRDDNTPRKLTVTQALADDEMQRMRSAAAFKRARERERRQMLGQEQTPRVTRDVVIPETLTVGELANRMAERGADVVKALMKMGVMATITQTIDADTAELVVSEFGHRVKRVAEADVELGIGGAADIPDSLSPRPPVVTVMGHVDHGKTSLLDALRKTDVAAGEAGGITQHIGAYQVALAGGQRVTFIDTPGHAAFTEMRARGANVTDIVILVVAADDGIMPQTVEAIRHAKAAKVPIVVAINKCDLPAAKSDRVRQDLLQHDLQVEQLGGEVQSVEVSAKSRVGLDKLLEAVLLQAEILQLRANPDRLAEGRVIEAKIERGRGSVATVLVQRGTLRVGDVFVAGCEWGRVRAMLDDRGAAVPSAPPAMPVEVQGLQGTPLAGDDFMVVENENRAREVAEFRQRKKRQAQLAATVRTGSSMEAMFQAVKAGTAHELPILLKGDVQGSLEAIRGALEKMNESSAEVKVRVLDASVGAISESDVTLAAASKGVIIGFNVRANPQARELAKRDGVEIRYYAIIYEILDDVKALLSGLLAPTLREKFLGNASILQVFTITRVGKVAGCKVTEGIVKRGAKVRLLRDNVVIHEGTLKTLKRVKEEVKEVREGFECGMAFENYENIQPGDMIEAFEIESISRTL